MPTVKIGGHLFCIVVWLLLCSTLSAEERFTDNGDGTVTDHKMGLMWVQSDNLGNINWRQAKKWVTYTVIYTLSKRYEDWRLPTLNEVKSLYVINKNSPIRETACGMKIKVIPEIKLSCGWVWTSETKDISATVFTFEKGYQFPELMRQDKAHRALAVRSIR